MRACSVIVNERSSTTSRRAPRDFVAATRALPLSASRTDAGALSELARVPAPAQPTWAMSAAATSDTTIRSFMSEDHIARLHRRLAYLAWIRRRLVRRFLLRRGGRLRRRLRRPHGRVLARRARRAVRVDVDRRQEPAAHFALRVAAGHELHEHREALLGPVVVDTRGDQLAVLLVQLDRLAL